MAQPVDRSILQEIVRVIEARKKVPERVRVRTRDYIITYLEDHQRRLQDALQRYDSDRLNMLYGQLASKVKYQLLRRLGGRDVARPKAQKKAASGRQAGTKRASAPKPTKPAKKTAAPSVKKKTASPARAKRTSAAKPRAAKPKPRR